MAIKLFNVIGDKLIPDERSTHDFVLASFPRFFVKNLPDYPVFLQMKDPIEKMRRFPLLQQALRVHRNPLTTRYFSQTPYGCGRHEVKYCVVPEDPVEEQPIDPSSDAIANPDVNYLRAAMADTLASQDVTMRFMVQVAPEGADVDDATAEWTSALTPVARIRIPRQEFRSSRQMALAENISFNPWHAIADHRPLGSINAARLEVYRAISELRHRNGDVPMVEPDGTEI